MYRRLWPPAVASIRWFSFLRCRLISAKLSWSWSRWWYHLCWISTRWFLVYICTVQYSTKLYNIIVSYHIMCTAKEFVQGGARADNRRCEFLHVETIFHSHPLLYSGMKKGYTGNSDRQHVLPSTKRRLGLRAAVWNKYSGTIGLAPRLRPLHAPMI